MKTVNCENGRFHEIIGQFQTAIIAKYAENGNREIYIGPFGWFSSATKKFIIQRLYDGNFLKLAQLNAAERFRIATHLLQIADFRPNRCP